MGSSVQIECALLLHMKIPGQLLKRTSLAILGTSFTSSFDFQLFVSVFLLRTKIAGTVLVVREATLFIV